MTSSTRFRQAALLTLLALLLALPTTALAQRGAAARTVAGARPPELAQGAQRAGAQAPARSGLKTWLLRNFTVRTRVARLASDTKALVKNGQLTDAAETLVTAPVKARGFRERRAIASALRKVYQASLGGARGRSRLGDTAGTRDALGAIDALKQTNSLGRFRSFRADRATNRAVTNTLTAARKAGKAGNLALARDNLVLAGDLRGLGDRRVQRGVRHFGKNAMTMAKRAAKAGDFGTTLAALDEARVAAEVSGTQFDDRTADGLVRGAYERAVPLLLDQARRLVKSRAHDQAAQTLALALDIQSQVGVRPGFFARRAQAKLVSQLGPRLAAVQNARAAAQRDGAQN